MMKDGEETGKKNRRLVIVNDCAYVMEELIPHLSKYYDITFIKRTRNLFSKTFGIAIKIAFSKGDIYHVNYALQDAFLMNLLKGRLDVLHVHGSDVRSTLHSKLGWIVKKNLKNATKVLYATPDLEVIIKDWRPDAVYLPTPVDTLRFAFKNHYNERPKALYFKLNYEKCNEEVVKLMKKYGIELEIHEKNVPYSDMPSFLSNYDIFVDRFSIPSFSKTALESMSVGLATIDYRHRGNMEEIVAKLSDPSYCKLVGKSNRNYVVEKHDSRKVALSLKEIYSQMLNETRRVSIDFP